MGANEAVCTIRSEHFNHWIFEGVNHQKQFTVEPRNSWDVHPINITTSNYDSVQTNYVTLADCPRGPMIAEHQNCIALQFPLNMKYKETIRVLHNFVERQVKLSLR